MSYKDFKHCKALGIFLECNVEMLGLNVGLYKYSNIVVICDSCPNGLKVVTY